MYTRAHIPHDTSIPADACPLTPTTQRRWKQLLSSSPAAWPPWPWLLPHHGRNLRPGTDPQGASVDAATISLTAPSGQSAKAKPTAAAAIVFPCSTRAYSFTVQAQGFAIATLRTRMFGSRRPRRSTCNSLSPADPIRQRGRRAHRRAGQDAEGRVIDDRQANQLPLPRATTRNFSRSPGRGQQSTQ